MSINEIWKHRFAEHIKELSRYLRYMFNDHLMIVMLIAFSAGALYYKQWLSELSATFPYEWVMAVFLGVVLTTSSVRTFLKEPDIVFFLPIEHKMSSYFRSGFIYSFVIHSLMVVAVFFILVPMYIQFTNNTFSQVILILFILIILKGWNLLLSQRMFYFIESETRIFDKTLRFIFNLIFLALLFETGSFIYLLILLIVALLWLGAFVLITRGKTIKWEALIKEEVKQSSRFYRIANLFIDVPHLRNEVKPRRWLDWVSGSIPFQKEKLFDFLYLKTFIRSGEYLGLYVRLVVIAGFLVIGVKFPYAGLIIVPFFIYLSGLQLLALYKEHDHKIWLDLYPVSNSERLQAFFNLLFKLMVGKGILLSILLLWGEGIVTGLLSGIVSVSFSFLFVHYYLKKKLTKNLSM
jgi:ABC-2 type transport system permease protein